MNTKSMILVPTLCDISECWLYENKRYIFIENGSRYTQLPVLNSECEDILTELGIPFRPTLDGKGLEYWSKDKYEEIPFDAPLYVRYEGLYRYIKNYTGNVVTSETTEAAFQLADKVVKPYIEEISKKASERKLFNIIRDEIGDKPAVGIHIQNLTGYVYDCFKDSDELNLNFEGIKFKLLPVKDWYGYLRYVAVFNMNKIQHDANVTLEVPYDTEGIFIGHKGCNVRNWSTHKLWVPRIDVIGTR